MRAVVTGGAGFLGSHLCDRLLKEGWDVLAIDNLITGAEKNVSHLASNSKFRFLKADVSDPLAVDGDIAYVLHFASPASPPDYLKHPIATMKVGSIGTLNALDLALAKGAKFFLASTSECYGDPAVHPQREDYWGNVNPIGLRSMYDEAKRFSEACTMAYHRERSADTRLVRIFNTYGPRMDPYDGRVVISFIRQALNDEPLTVFGEGKQTRSLCYVSDLVRGINLTMESDFHEPINLGNPEELSILQIAKEILLLIPDTKSKIIFEPMPPDDPRVRCPDITRAKQILGWTPVVSRREGLKKMIDFYREGLIKKA